MTFKRFFQLFIFYALSISIAYGVVTGLNIQNHALVIITMTVIGYVVLGLPLTVLSLMKKNYPKK
ncbi:hypothetical protein [Vagococcus fluvialis]|uniref:hypothetical protein n=1 Tax=Vagococcus fluvialis TaxID=2738 RepID=UPI003B58B671